MVKYHHRYRRETHGWKTVKERDKQLLDFIIIYILKIEEQHYSDKYIITLPMTPILNSSLNKQPMSWELIHCRLLNPSESVTKEMFLHQTLTDIPKQFTKKLNQTPYTICYTVNMTTSPKTTIWKCATGL